VTLTEVRSLAESRRLSLTDDLTGMPNRRHFYRQLDRAATDAAREGSCVAVAILDLDHFKELNDTLGHHAGDLVLKRIGERLEGILREGDFVGRLGGDEFAVLLQRCAGPQAEGAARRLRAAIAEPFTIESLTVSVGASIGIALAPLHATDADGLLQRADIAMYEAKERRLGHQVYDPERDAHSRARLAMTTELRRAIDERELVLHYQPKADLATGEIPGVEALVRWQHPQQGLLMPADFLGIAEQAGLMRRLTLHVLDLALAQCHRWREAGVHLSVAVNVNTANLLDLNFPNEVSRKLHEYDLAPEHLILEITEDTVMADPLRVMDILAAVTERGVSLSLDDFGTGTSSLGHLRRLPVREVKIDRSFVAEMASDHEDAAIVRTVVELGRSLGLRVVAEGIENRESLDRLAALGCDQIQGYFLARPMPANEVAPWLRGRRAQAGPGATLTAEPR
jgi:diguanylate cyclase (GGDEF)-like protein